MGIPTLRSSAGCFLPPRPAIITSAPCREAGLPDATRRRVRTDPTRAGRRRRSLGISKKTEESVPTRGTSYAAIRRNISRDRRGTVRLYTDAYNIAGGVAVDDVAKAHPADLVERGRRPVPALLGRREA